MMPSQEDAPTSSRRRRRRSEGSERSARPVTVSTPDDAALHKLIISGWVIALSYLPSGLLLWVVGDLVYLRDLALMVHLLASLVWLAKRNQLPWVAKHSWFIIITPVMLLPAAANHLYTFEALRTAKWSFAWLDWIILGHFVRLDRRWSDELKMLLWITFIMMGAELAAGIYDWVTGSHLIEESGKEKTVFGVTRLFNETIGGRIRIRGLQRDVFSFANIMAMNAVGGMAYLLFTRKAAHQLGALLWIFAFGTMMFISGGRSAIFGLLAAFVFTVGIFSYPRFTTRFEGSYVLAWVGIAIILSLVGVGKFTDFVGSTLLGGSYVGDAESAFMRDDFWKTMLGNFHQQPFILLAGGPAVALVDTRVDPMFHWADNQLLWNAYHLGLIGSVAFAFLFYNVLKPEVRDAQQRKVRQALILFLVFVIGEGIARESLVLLGCLPLFVLCGYEEATEMLALQISPVLSPLRRVSRRSSSNGGGG